MPTPATSVRVALEENPRYENAPLSGTGLNGLVYRLGIDVADIPVKSALLTPDPQWKSRADEVRGIEGAVPDLVDGYQPAGNLTLNAYLNSLPWLLVCSGFKTTVTQGAGGGTSEVQTITITGTPTGGTFTLTFPGIGVGASPVSTAALAWNASVATVQAALDLIFGAGNSVVAGGPLPGTALTVTFAAAYGTRDVPLMTAVHAFTGGASPAIAVTTTTPGVAGTVADPDGRTIPATAYRWVFDPRPGVTARTMQLLLNYVDQGVFLKGQGFGVSGLSLNSEGDVSADLTGLVLPQPTADPNITPSYDTQAIPFARRGDLVVGQTLANTGTSDDFSLAVANSLIRHRSMGAASYYPDTMSQGDDRVMVTGSIPKWTLAPADLNALLAGTTFPIKARWQEPRNIAATSYPYSMWWDMPGCQYTGGSPDALGNKRRHGGSFDFAARYDEAAGYHCRITIVGALASMGATFNPTNAAL